MKVYKCGPAGNFVGVAIVAANSTKEAAQLAAKVASCEDLYPEEDFEQILNLKYTGESPRVLEEYHFYIEEV